MKRIVALSLAALAACAGPAQNTQSAQVPPPPPAAPVAQAAPQEAPKPSDREPWRAERPKPGPEPKLVIPEFKKGALKNGMTILVSERHDLPLISQGIAFGAGAAADPVGKAGVGALTYQLLLEGAGKMDAIALDHAFAKLGGAPLVLTRKDGALVGTRVLTKNADAALALLAQVVKAPAFRPADFERKKKEVLADLALEAGNPRYLGREAAAQALYGKDHPYGQTDSGTPASVAALTLDDAKRFYAGVTGPKDAALIVTGDVTMEQATAWANKYFGDWKGKAERPPRPRDVPNPTSEVLLVPKPGLAQTLIIMGRPGVKVGAPDQAEAELASTVFGGFFGSRLNMDLREAKGYSYGASAYVEPRRGEGPVVAASSVRADVTGPSVKAFLDDLDELQKKPITEQELSAARDGLIRSLPGSFTTVEDLMRSASGLFWNESPTDYYDQLVTHLRDASLDGVRKAAAKYFDPKVLDLVLVGDPELVKAQVQPLLHQPIELHTIPGATSPPAAGAPTSSP